MTSLPFARDRANQVLNGICAETDARVAKNVDALFSRNKATAAMTRSAKHDLTVEIRVSGTFAMRTSRGPR